MKKLLVLLVLFVSVVIIAVGIVVNEQKRRSTLPAQDGEQISPTAAAPDKNVVPTVPASSNEGNITLVIVSPQDKATVADSTVTIQGKTVPGANVMINEYELTAGPDGTFAKPVALDDGENYFSIVAYTVNGDVAERQIMVTKSVSSY